MPSLVVGLNAVLVAVTDDEPRVLTVGPGADSGSGAGPGPGDEGLEALPFGPLDPQLDRTLELALRGWVREQTGMEVGYVEQLYTFGDKHRDPRERLGGPRVLSIGYLTLAREDALDQGAGENAGDPGEVRWRDAYAYLPWEDWREGRPKVLARIESALDAWAESAEPGLREPRRERVDIAFGLHDTPWDGYRVLDRYELLYEAGLVAESARDRGSDEKAGDAAMPGPSRQAPLGRAMRLDHRRILATALSRLRGKIKYRPVVFELLPDAFTLLQLQRVVEALAGQRLHKQNFRRLVDRGGLVEGTGRTADTGGRPAELFRFRREVLRERPQPGVGLPGLPAS